MYKPDGYNNRIKIGKWAGQSTNHLCIPVTPQYKGDEKNRP